MLTLRKASDRGHFDHGWLDTWHTFSFADYLDRAHMGFGPLRVINDDTVKGGGGFPPHPHRDMEIITYVIEGALAHQDSLGHGSTIRPGDVQRMSAGPGIVHSEFNASKSDPVHLLQIWILPRVKNTPSSYEQKFFAPDEKRGKLRLVASPDGAEGSVTLQQDARMYAALLEGGRPVRHSIARGRKGWIHVVQGTAEVNGRALAAGDGLAVDAGQGDERLTLRSMGSGEVLLFDMVG